MAATSGYREVLRHPVAGRLWWAYAVSTLGDYVAQGALLLLAFERSGDRAIGAAALYAVSAAPALLSGALAGSWLDQVPRRRALVVLQLLGALVVLVPVFLGGLAPVFVAAALLGAIRASMGAVRSGAMAEAVPDELRGRLIALLGTTQTGSEVVGYVSGATVTIAIGAGPALIADAVTFAIGAVVVAVAPFPLPLPRDRRPPVLAGFREIAGTPVLRLLAPLVAITAAVGTVPEVLAAEAAESQEAWTPYVLASGPLGHSLTLAWLGRFEQVRRPSVQLTHFVALSLALGLGAFASGNPLLLLGANAAIGAGLAWLLGPQLTFVSQARPERMAQVTGAMVSLIIVAEGLGSPAIAAIADRVSVAAAYHAAGLLVLVAALIGWYVKERTPDARQLDLPAGAPRLFDVWTADRPRSAQVGVEER